MTEKEKIGLSPVNDTNAQVPCSKKNSFPISPFKPIALLIVVPKRVPKEIQRLRSGNPASLEFFFKFPV